MTDNHTIRSMSETTEIDLVAVIWRLLRQWKCVLIVAILFGLLASAALHLRGGGEVEDPQNPVAELEDVDRQAVETALLEETQLNDVLNYLEESALMQSNPQDLHYLEILYYIDAPETLPARERALLRRAYVSSVRSDDIYEVLEHVGAIENATEYPSELVSGSYELEAEYVLDDQEKTSRSDSYSVSVLLTKDADTERIEAAVSDFLNAQTVELSAKYGAHTIKKLYSFTRTSADYDASSRKYGLLQQSYNLRTQIKALKDAFTDTQMAYYNEQIEETASKEGGEPAPAAAPQPASRGWFNKKYFVVGFVLGIVLYAIVLILRMMRKRRIESPAALEAAGHRVFGAFYQPGVRSGLLESRLFYRMSHRGMLDLQDRLDRIGDAVAATAEHRRIDALTLMPLGDAASVNGAVEQLRESLARVGVTAEVTPLYADGKDGGSDQAFLHQKPVVPIVIGTRTTTEMVDAIADRCAHYDVGLLGVIYAG